MFNPPHKFINPSNIYWGNNVSLGSNAMISALNAKFICGDNCAIAERLTVLTGNHARIVGKYITEVTEDCKPEGYDRDVVIQDDVWIGANVTILSGCIIGRGCTIGAGAVVTKSTMPYSVYGGVPAKFIKFYWTIEQIIEHESCLYPKEKRITMEELKEMFQKYND